MKTLTQKIIPIVTLSLLAAGVVSANNASDEEIQATKTDVGAMLAQAKPSQPATPAPPTVPTPTPTPRPAILQPTQPTLPTSVNEENVRSSLDNLTRRLAFETRSGSSDMVLVIPTEQTKTEDLIAINEDMNVMSRIFEKNLEQDRITTMQGSIFIPRFDTIGTFLGPGTGKMQSMYLQGYGALFMMKVDFPLSPSPDVQQEQQDTEKPEQGDSVWKQTKQEMFEPEKVGSRRRTDQPEVKYDPEKVEDLKTTLIRTLKHAANIRILKPDESVILTIAGGRESTGTKIAAVTITGNNQVIVEQKDDYGKRTMRIVNGTSLDDIGLSSPTVLVIRTKKSEIDAFAKGELDFDKFRAGVQMFSYPYLGSVELRGDNLGLRMDMMEPSSTSSVNTR
jgi:hypothetical protein